VDLYIGAFVESEDGQDVGTVERIILDLASNEVTYYVVHTEVGRQRDVLVPAEVADAREHILSLSIPSEEVEKLPDYLEVKYGLPPSPVRPTVRKLAIGREGGAVQWLPEGQTAELTGGQPVDCVDGEVGTLEGVQVDDVTAEVLGLVIGVTRRRKSARVPTAWASRLGPTRIQLQCNIQEVESLT